MEAVYVDSQKVELRAAAANSGEEKEQEEEEACCRDIDDAATMYSMVVEMQDTVNADRDNDSDCDSKMIWIPNEDNFSILALQQRVKNLTLHHHHHQQQQPSPVVTPTRDQHGSSSALSSMSSQMAKEWLRMGDNNYGATSTTTTRRSATRPQKNATCNSSNTGRPVLSPSKAQNLVQSLHLPLPLGESSNKSTTSSPSSSSSSSVPRWLLGRRRSCSMEKPRSRRHRLRGNSSSIREGDKNMGNYLMQNTTEFYARGTRNAHANHQGLTKKQRQQEQQLLTKDRAIVAGGDNREHYHYCKQLRLVRRGLRSRNTLFYPTNNKKKAWMEGSSYVGAFEELKDDEDDETMENQEQSSACLKAAVEDKDSSKTNENDHESDSDSEEEGEEEEECKWKEATDAKSGKTYYYHVETRQSQWQKPIELASREERQEAERKERETREFFASMEANILKSISEGAYTATTTTSSATGDPQDRDRDLATATTPADGDGGGGSSSRTEENELVHLPEEEELNQLPKPQPLVRTISTMDKAVLRELVQRVPSHRNVLMSYSSASSFSEDNNNSNNMLQIVNDEKEHDSPHDVIAQTVQQQQQQQQQSTTTSKAPTTTTATAASAAVAGSAPRIQRTLTASSSNAGGGSNLVSIVEADHDSSEDSDSGSSTSPENGGPETGNINTDSQEGGTAACTTTSGEGWTWTSTRTVNSNISSGSTSVRDKLQRGLSTNLSVCSLNLDALEPTERGNNRSMLSMESSFNLLGNSTYSFGLSEEETGALEKLAVISNEIANIDDEDEDALLGESLMEDDLDGAGLLADDEEDEAVAFHRSWSTDPGPQEGITYIPSPTASGASCNPKEIVYVPPNVQMTQSSTTTGTADQQSKPKATVVGGEASSSSSSSAQQRPRPALPRPVGFYSKPDKNNNGNNGNNGPMLQKPPGLMARRNTCGTLFVGSTMSAPDKDATVKCVCGVYRAHMQSEMEGGTSYDGEYTIFNDWETNRTQVQKENRHRFTRARRNRIKPRLPSLEEVTTFYRDIFSRAKMESECIIMSLVYVERLIKTTGGKLRPNVENWRSILFSCMVLSSKVWDDLSMWNADFSQTCPAGVRFPLKRVNELEIAVLSALKYNVKVLASEYAKYYFLMRSMLIKSGLGGEDAAMTPLDVEGAKRLQHVSALYQSSTSASYSTMRSKSVGSIEVTRMMDESSPISPEKSNKDSAKVGKALLEHIVEM